jgi:hypothetical protein
VHLYRDDPQLWKAERAEPGRPFRAKLQQKRDAIYTRMEFWMRGHGYVMSPNKAGEAITRPRAPALDDLHAAQDRAAELDNALKALRAAVARSDAEPARARNRATELEAQSAALARGVAELDRALTAQTRKLNAIKASVSWRITASFRKVGARFPWLARQGRRMLKPLWWGATLQLLSRLRARRRQRLELQLIASSGLLDSDWYFQAYPDVHRSGANAAVHYLRHGAAEHRDPCPLFDSGWYLERNPDVRKAGRNPLVHYLQHGAAEGRDPSPVFDSKWYLSQYPDVAASGMNPLVHYVRHGTREGRDPNPAFSKHHYLQHSPDKATPGVNPVMHFALYGAEEGENDFSFAPSKHSATRNYGQRTVTYFGFNNTPMAWYRCSNLMQAINI